jgi:hypothetical protein
VLYLCFLLWEFCEFALAQSKACQWVSGCCDCKLQNRCPTLVRLVQHATTRKAFQRSFLAFVLTSYEPFVEVRTAPGLHLLRGVLIDLALFVRVCR